MPLAVAATVLALAHVPLLVAHMHYLRLKPHYESTPLVFVVGWCCASLEGVGADSLRASAGADGADDWAGDVGIELGDADRRGDVGFAVAGDGVVLGVPLATIALLAGGWQVVRAAMPALIFLLLLVPPPMNLTASSSSACRT